MQLSAQDSVLQMKQTNTIKGDFADMAVDKFGNIFLVTSNNQIKKLNSHLDSLAIYNESAFYGNIASIDVSNPLKILVYYKDFNTIVTLDRQLNKRNIIDLRTQNIFQASAIALSYDNNIWLIDEQENKLKKIDESGSVLLETRDFRTLFNQGFRPISIIDDNNLLYLYSPSIGWKVFDYYGGLKSEYSFLNWKDVQVKDNFLMGHDTATFYANKPQSLEYQSLKSSINLKLAKKIIKLQNSCYVLTAEGVSIFNLL